MAADSMPSTSRKHLNRCAPPALSFRSRAGRCGCDSLSLASSRQRVKSLRSSVRLRLVFYTARLILSRRVFHSASTTHPLRSCSVSASFPTHLPRARSPARLFLPLSLQSQTRNVVSLSGCLCPDSLFAAAVSSLVTQRLSAFRSCLAPAYRLCYAPRLSAESSEPSGKGFVPQPLPPVSSALTASSRSAFTRPLTLRRRPDSHAQRWVAFYLYSWLCAGGGVTVVPRSNLIPSAACRGLRPCLLAFLLLQEMSADAATPERAKLPSPTTLTHAPSACRISPVSHARRGLQGYKHINL